LLGYGSQQCGCLSFRIQQLLPCWLASPLHRNHYSACRLSANWSSTGQSQAMTQQIRGIAGHSGDHWPSLALTGRQLLLLQLKVNVKVSVMLRQTASQPVCLGFKPHLGPKTIFSLL
jgi:hypothetical protein